MNVMHAFHRRTVPGDELLITFRNDDHHYMTGRMTLVEHDMAEETATLDWSGVRVHIKTAHIHTYAITKRAQGA